MGNTSGAKSWSKRAAALEKVAAMLEASALDLDLDLDADADRERGATVARVEPGEAVVRTNSSPN